MENYRRISRFFDLNLMKRFKPTASLVTAASVLSISIAQAATPTKLNLICQLHDGSKPIGSLIQQRLGAKVMAVDYVVQNKGKAFSLIPTASVKDKDKSICQVRLLYEVNGKDSRLHAEIESRVPKKQVLKAASYLPNEPGHDAQFELFSEVGTCLGKSSTTLNLMCGIRKE
jgi:hypothetical protein